MFDLKSLPRNTQINSSKSQSWSKVNANQLRGRLKVSKTALVCDYKGRPRVRWCSLTHGSNVYCQNTSAAPSQRVSAAVSTQCTFLTPQIFISLFVTLTALVPVRLTLKLAVSDCASFCRFRFDDVMETQTVCVLFISGDRNRER